MGSAAERTERLYAQLMVEHKALGRLYDELEISLAGELSDLRSSVRLSPQSATRRQGLHKNEKGEG